MTTAIDHFVVGAATLEEGRAWMENALGVPAAGGGMHAMMGTHNALWRLDRGYLEVIAIDPAAPRPDRPRWFGLDDPVVQARLSVRPRLLTWVARCAPGTLDETLEGAAYAPGEALSFNRDTLRWRLTVPEDGHPAGDGRLPGLIEWENGSIPPSETLRDDGLRLERFRVMEEEGIADALASIGTDGLAGFHDGAPLLSMAIATPRGEVVITS
ncbi:MAG: VOC family protein [Rubricella sp.]